MLSALDVRAVADACRTGVEHDHDRHGVPVPAELTLAVVVIVVLLVADLRGAIAFSSFGVLLYYFVANIAATRQDPAHRRYPKAVAVVGAILCLILVATVPVSGIITGVVVVAFGILARVIRMRCGAHAASTCRRGALAGPGGSDKDAGMIGRAHHVVFDCPEPERLAAFYSDLFGLPITFVSDDWVVIARDAHSSGYAFQLAPEHIAPRWPDPDFPQQMHLDVMVDDLDEAGGAVIALGARRLPGGDNVYADPAGHPFCLIPLPGWAAPPSQSPAR